MLVAVRRSIPSSAQVLLEIPSAPLAALAALPRVARSLRAKVLRMQHGEGYNLVGLKFSRPLLIRTLQPSRCDGNSLLRCENLFPRFLPGFSRAFLPFDYQRLPPSIFSKLLFINQID